MAGNMDERVVSMEFDNKQFEKNVRTSMKTIDDLKESLDFDDTGESFDEFTKKCKKFGKDNCFKDVDDSVSKLRKGIGLLGDSAGGLISQFAEVTKITAMFEMAEAAVNRLKAAVKSFTIEPISQGFDKYTTKINSIKTIANATGMAADMVDASLDRLNWFTDETSASFDSMVQNIGKFTSVGKGLDESITAMQGIAAWGYHSGASVQEQNRAMYNLSQALGTGSVKLIDWKSIENAGMATKEFKEQAIAAAEAAGTLTRKGDKLFAGKEEVTVENFNSTLQKGWFTSDVLMDVLKEYGSFADKVRKYQEEHPQYALASEAMEAMDAERLAKQDAIWEKYLTTWSEKSGKTSNKVKEEVARINKIANVKEREKEIKAFAKTVGMSYEEAKRVLDDLASTEETLGEKAFKSSQQSKSFTDSIEATKDAVSTGWMNTFQYIFGGLDKSIELWSDVTEILWDLFAAGASFRNNAFMHWAEEFNGWADLWNANEENGPLGALRNIMDTIIELKDLLGSSFKNVFFPELAKITGEIFGEEDAKTMAKNGLKTTDQLKHWREGNYMGYQIKQVTSGIREFTAKIRAFFTEAGNLEKIKTIFTSIATVVRFAVDTIGGFFRAIGNFVTKSGILRDTLSVVSAIAQKITDFVGRIQKSGFVKNLFGKISDTFVWFYQTVKRWIDEIREFFEETGIGQAIRDFFKGIEEFFLGGEGDLDEHGKKTESGFFRAFGWVRDVKAWFDKINLKQVLYDVKAFIENFGTLWGAFTAALNGEEVNSDQLVAAGLPENLKGAADVFANVGKALSGVFGFFKSVWEGFTGWLESSGILPTLRSWWEGISNWFEGIKKDISENGFFGWIGSVFSGLWKTITGIFTGDDGLEELEDYATPLSSMVGDGKKKGVFANIVTALKNAASGIKKAFNWVKDKFEIVINWLTEKWSQFTNWLETSGILPAIRSFWEKVKIFFTNFGEVWAAFKTSFSGQKLDKKALKNSGMDEGLQGIIETVWSWGNGIHNAIEWVKETWGKITDWLETSGILPTLRGWWAGITGWFEGVAKDIEENGVFGAVSNFFTNLWETITGLFGGGPNVAEEASKAAGAAGGAGDQKGGFLGGFFDPLVKAFTNKDGKFDLIHGISTGISGFFELIGSIDWTSIAGNVFGVMVDIINGLDDACGKLHIGNILKVIKDILGAFTGIMIVKSITDITSTIRTIVKKGKDKTLLEKFTELLTAIGTALLQIGIAIALIAGSMWLISQIDEKRFGAAVGVMIGIGVFLIGFLVIAYVMTRTMGKDANKLAKTFAAIGSMFLQIALAIAIVVAAVWLVSMMLGENGEISDRLRNAMIIVGGLMLVMAGIVILIGQLTKNVGTTNVAIGIATFAGIAILLATCVAAILLLQNVDPGKAFIVIGEITVLLGLITAMLVVLSKTVKKFNPKMLVGMITMAVMLGLVVAALVILKDVPEGHLIETAGAIAIVIGVMVGALALCGVLGTKILIGAGVLAGAIVILGVALAAVAAIGVGVMNNVLTITSTLAAISNSAKLVDTEAIGNAFEAFGIIIQGLTITVTVNTAPALAIAQAAWDVFGLLNLAGDSASSVKIDAIKSIIGEDGNGGILSAIKTALASVTEATAGDNAKSLGRSFNSLAINLQLAGRAGMNLGDGSDHTTGIQNIKSRLTDIQEIVTMANEIIPNAEGQADTDRLTKFAEGVANIGAALQLYNTALAKAETELAGQTDALNGGEALQPISTQNIKEALQSIVDALPTAVPSGESLSAIESWAKMSTGEGGQTLFALGLVNIANAMDEFSKSAQTFASDNVSKAVESLKTLAAIQTNVPNPSQYDGTISGVSGWSSQGVGENGTFAEAIVGMGNAMKEFGESVSGIKMGYVLSAIIALKMLKSIYTEMNGQEEVITYFGSFGEKIQEVSKSTKSVADVFSDFGLGIEHLGGALKAFNDHINVEGYDGTKVQAAVEILKDIKTMQTELQGVDIKGSFLERLVFGDNDLKKLGENMAGLGSRLTTFQQELSGFNLDIDGTEWKNISGVLSFMTEIWKDLGNIVTDQAAYDEENQLTNYVTSSGYTLENLANGINKIRESMVEFNKAMQKTYTGEGGGNTYKLGEWAESNWKNIMAVINDLKQMTIDLKNAGLKEGQFYDLDHFAFDIKELVNELNGSKLTEFMNKLDVPDNPGSITSKFAAFAGCIKALVEASATLHGSNVNTDDIKNMTSIVSAIMGMDSTGWNAEQLNLDALTLATQFVSGFATALTRTEAPEGTYTVGGAMDALLAVIEGYAESFLEKGKNAGEQYATGFNQGLESIDSGRLTPVIDMDETGSVTGGTGIVAVLSAMKYATSADIGTLAERLDTINAHFTNPINVNDGHAAALNTISGKLDALDKLENIKSDVSSLKADVKNLKVYIDSKILVGAIAPEMNRKLGAMANVSP